MENSQFCHLHVHSSYSVLDGFGTAEEYAKRSNELGFKYLAITDHGNVDGALKFKQACNKYNIKPIYGCEFYICDDISQKKKDFKYVHVSLFAKNKIGWQNMLKLLTIANTDGYYYRPRIDPELLLRHVEGIVVSTACCYGLFKLPGYEQVIQRLKNETDVYLEMMPVAMQEQLDTNRLCLEFNKKYNLPLICSNDCHYCMPEHNMLQEVLLAIQSKSTWNNPNRFRFSINDLFLKSADEMLMTMQQLGGVTDRKIIEAMNNTIKFAESMDFDLEKVKVFLPKVYVKELEKLDEDDQLIQLTLEGFEQRALKHAYIENNRDLYLERLEYELYQLINLNFSRYFLIVWELVNWCKKNDIICGPGRGCVISDTYISFADGTERTIKDITDNWDGNPFWVYSVDKNGKIVLGEATNPRITKYVNELCVVELDNGKVEKTTLDHGYMLRDGTYKEAKDLKPNDSLMPLYRKDGRKGHEMYLEVNNGRGGKWKETHYIGYEHIKGLCIHHKDGNKRNNVPENREQINFQQHLIRHTIERNKSQESRERSKGLWERNLNTEWNINRTIESNKDPELKEIRRQSRWYGIKKIKRKRLPKDIEYVASKASEFMKVQIKDPEYIKRIQEARLKTIEEKKNLQDHKVKSISFIKCDNEPVYDIEVKEYHNFALSSGIFVHNSSSGSLVSYCLGITNVDPIKYNLIFERFVSPERQDLPDIDMDFEDIKRDQIQKHLQELYGEFNVAGLSTFTRMRGRSTIRDVGRVFELPSKDVDKAAKSIVSRLPSDPRTYMTIIDSFENFEDGIKFKENYPKETDIAIKMEGTIRGHGRHAAAVCVSEHDLRLGFNANLSNRSNTLVCNWDKDDAEYMGLMKLDILGLNSLTVIHETIKKIKETKNIDIDIDLIPLDDQHILDEFTKGNTVCVFQFNGPSATKMCQDVRVDSFQDIVALNALNRPACLRSGMVDDFRNRKHGVDRIPDVEKNFNDITKDTYGVVLYQEQLMYMFNRMAGFPWSETDKVRKIVSKSKGTEKFDEYKERFVEGCKELDTLDRSESGDLFEKMRHHSEYSFPLSHSVTYSVIAYWMMWLKTKHPTEFMCSILTYGQAGDKKKENLAEARRLGIKIELPNINNSDATDWIIHNGALVIPLIEIKGIGPAASKSITTAKTKVSFFESKEHFLNSVSKRTVNSKVVGLLETLNCFDVVDIKTLGEPELARISEYFDFDLSNDPMFRYRKMFNRIRKSAKIRKIKNIDPEKVDDKSKNFWGRMIELKTNFKEIIVDGENDQREMVTGIYGRIQDDEESIAVTFDKKLLKEKKDFIEHVKDEWVMISATSLFKGKNTINCENIWSVEDFYNGKFEEVSFNLLEPVIYEQNNEWGKIATGIGNCNKCELRSECRHPVVPSKGAANVMIIGEYPSKYDDIRGEGFAGDIGKILFGKLAQMGYNKDMFHITNVCKCYPETSKTPNQKHVNTCSIWIEEEIKIVKPIIVLIFGNTGLRLIKNESSGIKAMNGKVEWNDKYNCWICYSTSPASMIYYPENEVYIDESLNKFTNLIEKIGLGI